ncbi:MAG TPA: hypothetical protein VK053_01355 [Jiangellaceae bacterium]|nr:hypothetical protein [Jiangellaceae bacterium]
MTAPRKYDQEFRERAVMLVTSAELEDAYLANSLVTLHRENWSVYGVRKLWHAARRQGLELGRDQVAPADGHRRPRRRRPRPAHYAHHPARGGRPDTQTWSTQSYATGPTGEWTILLRARRG